MYRQVQINETQTSYQRIFWRNSSADNIKIFELDTVTYGTKSAPYLATRALNQLANDFEMEFPQASKSILITERFLRRRYPQW